MKYCDKQYDNFKRLVLEGRIELSSVTIEDNPEEHARGSQKVTSSQKSVNEWQHHLGKHYHCVVSVSSF